MNTRLTRAVALSMVVGGMTVAAGIAAAPDANAIPANCQEPKTRSISNTQGIDVEIPTDKAAKTAFQYGGQQSRSSSTAKITAETKGHADTVMGGGGLNFEVVSASASYNHQWNKSTTNSTSTTGQFTTTSPVVANNVHWRWKLYKEGRQWTSTVKYAYDTNCPNYDGVKTAKYKVWAPTSSGAFTWDIETYSTRGELHNHGKPFVP